jgi:hypothetical protein
MTRLAVHIEELLVEPAETLTFVPLPAGAGAVVFVGWVVFVIAGCWPIGPGRS